MPEKNIQSIQLIPGGHSIGVMNTGRDQILGMGTLTFIEPNFYSYGALGHIMSQVNRGQLKTSYLIPSLVKEIKRSVKGDPGNKIGDFFEQIRLGTIAKNTKQGIFGKMQRSISNPYFKEPISVASRHEIEAGPAKMYTVVSGDEVEEFNVTISTTLAMRKNQLDLEIQVDDSDLIQRTGGFVKGMSGSPIVQNGKLVGAFSYISGRDSLCGYGVLVEKMLLNLRTHESHSIFESLIKMLKAPAIDVRTVNSF